MKYVYARLITLLCVVFLSIMLSAQNTSPVKVVEFRMIPGGIMDELRLEKNQRTDYDDNPVCEIKVKAQGFDEEVMQRFKFSANGPWITKVEFDDKNEWRIYLSSKRRGSLKIKYQGDCVFDLPAALEPKKIYELTLGMETATLNIITTPDNATIYIDDEEVGVGYGSKAVSIGAEHRYKVECENYITEENVVVFAEKEKKEIAIELRPNFGYITVKTTPSGADVYVDDKLVGKTPYLSEVIKRGMHKITVNKEGFETSVQRVNINLNEEETIEFELVEGESSMPVQQVVQQPVAQPVAAQKPENGVVTDADGNVVATVNGVDFKMIKVEGGTFTMGEGKEAHEVTLSEYYIGEFEVTQELWEAVMGSNPSYCNGVVNPVEKVSWNDCQGFIMKLSRMTGGKFRLPTEAEWEYAARGGNKSKGYEYSGSNVIDEVAWYFKNSGSGTHPVGTKLPNELGIYDMIGNVREWCQDWYGEYSGVPQTNPQGPSSDSHRVLRGGSWKRYARYSSVSYRNYLTPDNRSDYDCGFRLALVL